MDFSILFVNFFFHIFVFFQGKPWKFSKFLMVVLQDILYKSVLCLHKEKRVDPTHQVTLGERHVLRLLEFLTSGGDELKGLPAVHQRFPNKPKEHRQSIPRIKGTLNHTRTKSLPRPPSLVWPRWEDVLHLAAGSHRAVWSSAGCSCIFSSPSAPLSPSWPSCAALRSSPLNPSWVKHTKVTECQLFDVPVDKHLQRSPQLSVRGNGVLQAHLTLRQMRMVVLQPCGCRSYRTQNVTMSCAVRCVVQVLHSWGIRLQRKEKKKKELNSKQQGLQRLLLYYTKRSSTTASLADTYSAVCVFSVSEFIFIFFLTGH